MTPNDYTALILAFVSILGSLAVAVRFLVKHYLSELKPNGGSSMKDRVGEIEKKIDKLDGTPHKRFILSIVSDYDLNRSICELIDNVFTHQVRHEKFCSAWVCFF